MLGHQPAKRTPQDTHTYKEPPLKFKSGKRNVIVKEVFDITPVHPVTYLIRFTLEDEPVFDFQPGQFISIFAEKEGRIISRPYSIASPPENKDYLELCIKVVEGGFMSNYLHTVPPGTKLRAMGPLGRFVMLEPVESDIVFVATGTGVAPFVSMLGHIMNMGNTSHDLYLFFGVRYVYDLIYRDLFEGWAKKYSNFHFIPTISRPETPDWKGRVGYVQKALQETIKDPSDKHVYICGLHDMVEQTKTLCENMGFPVVRFEKWD